MKSTSIPALLIVLFFSLAPWSGVLMAQPGNDDCAGIIDLGEAPICPVIDTFTNVDATGSMVFTDPAANVPSCFMGGQPDSDVWFSFDVPVDGSVIDFEVIVSAVNGPNGPILQPQIAVYRGDCELNGLEELICASAGPGESTVEVPLDGLTPGFTYYLRIDSWSGTAAPNWGDFELCVKEPDIVFNIGDEPGSSACSGTLFDSGGPMGNYSNNETHVFTVCPSDPTGCITIDVASFTIENGFDNLTIFEGSSTAGAQVANFTGGGGPASFQIGADCFTVLFDSDISITQAGFELNWSCSPISCNTTFVPCEQTSSIFFLPFQANGVSTCGSGDDVQDGPCDNSAEVLAGEDFIYTFNSPGGICADILLTGVDPDTWLSIYNDCPENADNCMAVGQSTTTDTILISNLSLPGGTLYFDISNANCTDFNILIEEVECLQIVNPAPLCEDAIVLNSCNEPPTLFDVSQLASPIPEYFQPGINDGCWEGIGAGHFTWLIFQAQVAGDFAFLASNSSDQEDADINFQIWGPISESEDLCDFIENNQPVRSSYAPDPTDITGLTDTHPINGTTITDDCEGVAGDGFLTPLAVDQDMYYLILMNDHSGNMVNSHLEIDFSGTSPGVLDGLPEDTPLSALPYYTTGTAFHDPQNGDFSCIQLTDNLTTQGGCAWAAELVDFSQPFVNNVTMFFGTNDGGADGLCMVYHLDDDGFETCGITGGGIAALEIDNSLIIEFDTWQNTQYGDPIQDHIAVNVNGDMASQISGPPVQMGNIEDGQEHEVTFSWDPATNTYEIYFDGALIITGVYDVINDCFGGESMVYCGFTASTGAAFNQQYVCTGNNVYPTGTTDTTMVQLCDGESYFAEGQQQTTSGLYTDIYQNIYGCDSIIVTNLSFFPVFADTLDVQLCDGESYFAGGMEQTTSGLYTDTYVSIDGCDSLVVTDLQFAPVYSDDQAVILCAGESFFVGGAEQTTPGVYEDSFTTIDGCDSLVTTTLSFVEVEADLASPDPLTCENPDCVLLDASASSQGGFTEYAWTTEGGSLDLSEDILMPTACGPGIYQLVVYQFEQNLTCTDTAQVEVISEVSENCYEIDIPNAFSPNGDGLNDFFKLVVPEEVEVIIVECKIFNRWGQLVYDNENGLAGWNGLQDGEPAPSDVYVYRLIYQIPALGTEEELMGEVSLLR